MMHIYVDPGLGPSQGHTQAEENTLQGQTHQSQTRQGHGHLDLGRDLDIVHQGLGRVHGLGHLPVLVVSAGDPSLLTGNVVDLRLVK